MTPNEYQELVMRTAPDYETEMLLGSDMILLDAALGLSGESGEFTDFVKKLYFQGHKADDDKLIDELSDVLWYCALAATALDTTLEDVMEHNIEKLRKRYPDGFDAERSRSRSEEFEIPAEALEDIKKLWGER